MRFETFIARRYLSTHRRSLFASLILFITLLAVATGVFALIFVLAVMNGFENDSRQRILGFKAPLVVVSDSGEDLSSTVEEWRRKDSRISKVVPFVEGEAILKTESGGILGVRVRGISGIPDVSRLGELYESEPFSESSLLLGNELMGSLKVHPDFFDKIRLIFPFGEVGPTGDLMPRVRRFTLTGSFRSGFYDFDSKYVLVPYREASRLFGGEARTGLEIWVEPPHAEDAVKRVLEQGLFPGIHLETWRDQNPKLFAAMKLEKIGMFLLLFVLLLIACFNIFGLTSLTVMDKIREMTILRAVGLTARGVRRIFLLKAAGIGIGGSLAGGIVGLVVTFFLQRHPIHLPSSYYLENLPIQVELREVLLVLFLVPILTTLSAFYPAWQASRRHPVEALRYE